MSGLLVLSRLLSLFLLLALAGPAAAQYGQPEGRKSAESRTKNMVPMIFYVATGEPGACGPGCSTWIAAEGALDREAAERLRAFLAQLGRRKLPIYFHSPGGSMGNALLIGRMLRARRMSAGVARLRGFLRGLCRARIRLQQQTEQQDRQKQAGVHDEPMDGPQRERRRITGSCYHTRRPAASACARLGRRPVDPAGFYGIPAPSKTAYLRS